MTAPRTAAGRRFLDWWQGREYVTVTLDWAKIEVAAIEAEAAQLDVERLAAALHPEGRGPVVDCCMGGSLDHIEDPAEREARHRYYHREDAEALASAYAKDGSE